MNRPLPRLLLPLLAAIQFTHIMDFMVLMPLGPQLMRDLHMGAGGFSALVAAYSIAAGVIGLAGAPFIDRYDRRTLVLTIYGGFLLSTLFCGLAQSQTMLMIGRILAGGFGGISGSLCLTVVSDIVPPERRAAGIGIVMTAFALAAAIGVPIGLELAQIWSWRCPFLVVASVALIAWITAYNILPELRGHLAQPGDRKRAFMEVLRDPNAWRALAFMASMVLGHFTIIPLLSTHLVSDVHYPESLLWLVYFVGGALSVVTAPQVGKLSDRLGRQRVFGVMVLLASIVVVAISNIGPWPVWAVLTLSGAFFIFASGRFVPGQAIITLAVPATRRGAFLSLSSCARDLMSGIASSFGGWIVVTKPNGELAHYNWLGWIAVGGGALSIWLSRQVRANEVMTDLTKKAAALPAEDIPMEAGEIS